MLGVTSRKLTVLLFAAVLAITDILAGTECSAGDWPTWRYDARRSAASPNDLPAQLQLQWVRRLPALKPAWPDQPKMQFDAAYEPIVAGQHLYLGSSFDNSVTCYDTRTGKEKWRYYTDGPVRFAPLAFRDKLYFVSDDGYLYCVHATNGSLKWRFRGGPSEKRILGNERLISMWPARGAPIIVDDTIYFAAGIWPFMGIFLHAVNCESGEVIWTNDGDGSIYIKQPHNTDSFAGVAPQGPLVAIGEKLLVPGGRSVPACYERATGKLLYYQLADNGKRGGGSSVAATDQFLFNGGAVFDLANESYLGSVGQHLVFTDTVLYDSRGTQLRAIDLVHTELADQEVVNRKGEKTTVKKWTVKEVGKAETATSTALIKAGARLFLGSAGQLAAYSLPLPDNGPSSPVWQVEISGNPASMVGADDRLFVSTLEGELYCFGDPAAGPNPAIEHPFAAVALPVSDSRVDKLQRAVASTGVRDGYCVVLGIGSGQLVRSLLQDSNFRVVVIEKDPSVANALRRQLSAAGIGSERITVLVENPWTATLPPYLANLVVTESSSLPTEGQERIVENVFGYLRPFGGTACLPISATQSQKVTDSIPRLTAEKANWKSDDGFSLLIREGALPESANWTHEHADASNTRVSKDSRVKAPLGLLWFGGPSNDAILPRHGHGPQPQVVDGRLFIEGMDLLRAMDIYTGRVLWEAQLPGVGSLYDNTAHQPGANASGTNYIATPHGIYVAYRDRCTQLDPVTGETIRGFQLPALPGTDKAPLWGYINVVDNYLVGGAEPLFDSALTKSRGDNDNYSSSKRLVVLDRTTGKVLWSATAESGFRHNAICLGGGRLYCIDRLSGAELSRAKRRGETPANKTQLVVFDLNSGSEMWRSDHDIFGTWLSYSSEHDVLVEAGRVARDTLSDEPKGMRAYRASDGSRIWENKSYSGPAMIHHNTILMAGSACELWTGNPKLREHPLSGEPVEWSWSRNYGCNTPMASEHLLTFRSGAAGYFDFCNDGGTGNFGGFRSSCTNNLIVAGGLLNAPEYTRTCTCSYQNQTSLALIHMPEVETWTSFGAQSPKQLLKRVGINLGAPGDRKSDDGTLWLEYPSVGGASPQLSVRLDPEQPTWFRRHSSAIDGPGLDWVAASGAKGLNSLDIKLGDAAGPPRRYAVRLHFVEPDEVAVGERIVDVAIQGKPAVAGLDVMKEAGGRYRSLVKQFSGIEVTQNLRIELKPNPHGKVQSTVLCGVEIQSEGW